MIGGVEDLRREISAVAGRLGVAAADLSRAKFRAEHPEGSRNIVNRLWTEARRGAEVKPADVPLVPPGFAVHGVSTFDGGKWIKASRIKESKEEVLTRLLATLPDTVPVRAGKIKTPSAAGDDDRLSVICIGDAHIGAFSWAKESGDDYDLTIAEALMSAAISDLVDRGPNTKLGLLINLGDFFTADNSAGTTTAGTAQSTDSRFPKVLETGMRMIVHAIDSMLAKHERVIVDTQAGNHDHYTAIMLAIGLRAHFRNEPRAEIMVNPAKRHYHQFGEVLIGTTHGDQVKIDALPGLMAAEAAPMWGGTRHRYWYLGHYHHTSRKDFPGCTVETFRTLAGRDAWHAASGYLAPRDMQRIVLHKQFGEVSREVANVDYLRAKVKTC